MGATSALTKSATIICAQSHARGRSQGGCEVTDKHGDVERAAISLEAVAKAYGRHSGPQSDESARRSLHVAALRYARAYFAAACAGDVAAPITLVTTSDNGN